MKLFCSDFADCKPGFLPSHCCGSCHDDVSEGYYVYMCEMQPPGKGDRPYKGKLYAEVCCSWIGQKRNAWARAVIRHRKTRS